MNARGVDFTGIAYLAALGVGAFVVYKLVSGGPAAAKEAAGKVLDAINPGNPNNIAARAVNSVVQAATGDEHETLGTWLWRKLNPSQAAAEKAALSSSAAAATASSRPAPSSSGGSFLADYHATYTGSMIGADDQAPPVIGEANFS